MIYTPKFQSGKKIFLQPNDPKLPIGRIHPFYYQPSSELASSIGGEKGEPAYLIPTFKFGEPLKDALSEFRKSNEHLGGPFKTWQEADKWENEIRHPYVEKGQALPSPLKTWGYQDGGILPKENGVESEIKNPFIFNYKIRPQVLLQNASRNNIISKRNELSGMTDDMVYSPSHKIEVPEKAGAELYEKIRQQNLPTYRFGEIAAGFAVMPSNVSANCSASCKQAQKASKKQNGGKFISKAQKGKKFSYGKSDKPSDWESKYGVIAPEVEIKGKYTPGFWREYGDKIAQENEGNGLLGTITTLPMNALLSLPQMAATKLFSGKVQRPSEALNIKNPYGRFAIDAVADPLNLIGMSLFKKAPWKFEPSPGMMYRGIGKEGAKDAIESGVFRQAQASTDVPLGNRWPNDPITIRQKTFDRVYYSPDFEVGKRYGKGYIAEIPTKVANFTQRYPGNPWSQFPDRAINVSEGRILKENKFFGYRPIKTKPSKIETFVKDKFTKGKKGDDLPPPPSNENSIFDSATDEWSSLSTSTWRDKLDKIFNSVKKTPVKLAELKQRGMLSPRYLWNATENSLEGDSRKHVLFGNAQQGYKELLELSSAIKPGRKFSEKSLSSDSFPLVLAQGKRKINSNNASARFTGVFNPLNDAGNKGRSFLNKQFNVSDDFLNNTSDLTSSLYVPHAAKKQRGFDEYLEFINQHIKSFNEVSSKKIPDAKNINNRVYVPEIEFTQNGASWQDKLNRNKTRLGVGAGTILSTEAAYGLHKLLKKD